MDKCPSTLRDTPDEAAPRGQEGQRVQREASENAAVSEDSLATVAKDKHTAQVIMFSDERL
jgi:hypothetical protein